MLQYIILSKWVCLGGERMFEKVKEIIADKLSINEDEITMD